MNAQSTAKVVGIRRPDYKRIRMADHAMYELRMRLHDRPAKDIAEDAGVSPATIYGIKSGRTKWPRPATFFSLLEVLGLEMYLREAR